MMIYYQSNIHSSKIKLSLIPASAALYVAILDSPRMSRMDRNSRSVSQPRGKRDSSVSSAYGGGIFYGLLQNFLGLNRQLELISVSRTLIIFTAHKRTIGIGSHIIFHVLDSSILLLI